MKVLNKIISFLFHPFSINLPKGNNLTKGSFKR